MQMKKMTLALALMLAATTACFASNDITSTDDAKGVEQAVAQFYSSLNTLFTGDSAPMQEIWSHADDVTYMGPVGGFQIGWQQVGTVWNIEASWKLGGKIQPEAIHTTISGNLASVQCLEVGQNVDTDGKPIEVSIRATSLFRKENGQWKMIGHHTDLLEFLSGESDESSDNASDANSDADADSTPDSK